MALQLYNTRTRKVEHFTPLKEGDVGFYSCGPTVYDYAHIGNLRSFILADLLKRALLHEGFTVKHVMNITDVGHLTGDNDEGEDKMLKGAQREKKTVWQIAEFYTEAFMKDLERLHFKPFDVLCKATDHIKEMIALNKRLEDNGFTYVADGNLYFDTGKFSHYADLGKLNLAGMEAGARVAVDAAKKNPTDFVLWFTKSKFEDQAMKWDSPWGVGYPGWHIECSAMSTKYLGEEFDIHSGGEDHIPVHHTNEIAQTECATGKHPWVNFWVHGSFLVLPEGKMGKSLGNIINLQTVIDQGYDPLVYKYFTYSAHYRKQLTFTWEAMEGAQQAFTKLKEKVLAWKESDDTAGDGKDYLDRFFAAVNDDLNMPQALAVMWDLVQSDLGEKTKYAVLLEMDQILGLDIDQFVAENVAVPDDVQQLVTEREAARDAKDWAKADALRDQIKEKGFVVADGDGTSVIKKV